VAVANVFDSIDELSIRRMVLPKVKMVFEKNITDPKIVQNVLMCIERVMDRMERAQVGIIDNIHNHSSPYITYIYHVRTTGHGWGPAAAGKHSHSRSWYHHAYCA